MRVRDGMFGISLRGVNVSALDGTGITVFAGSIPLDSEGKGEIAGLKPGVYTLVVGSTGYAPVTLPGIAAPAAVVDVALTPGGRLEIHVGPETLTKASAGVALDDDRDCVSVGLRRRRQLQVERAATQPRPCRARKLHLPHRRSSDRDAPDCRGRNDGHPAAVDSRRSTDSHAGTARPRRNRDGSHRGTETRRTANPLRHAERDGEEKGAKQPGNPTAVSRNRATADPWEPPPQTRRSARGAKATRPS